MKTDLQGITLINARQVFDLTGISVNNSGGASVADQLARFGLKPATTVELTTGRTMYLYDQAGVLAALPDIKRQIRQHKAELHDQRVQRLAGARGAQVSYKAWCERLADAKSLGEIDTIVAEIKSILRPVQKAA